MLNFLAQRFHSQTSHDWIPEYSSKSTKAATEPLRFLNYEIDDFKSVLKNGENTLAIIVLNQRRTSPDVMFDAKLSVVSDESDPPMVASTLPPRGLAADLEQITVNFDEPVEGVDASDLLINGKPALAVTGGGRTWVFEPGPLSHGKVQLTWVQDHGRLRPMRSRLPPPGTAGRTHSPTTTHLMSDAPIRPRGWQ